MKQKYKLLLEASIILLTLAAFAYYVSAHGDPFSGLGSVSLVMVVVVLALYGMWFVITALTIQAQVFVCRGKIGTLKTLALSAYSTLANFFIPGQSGIVVRGLYLKKQHKIDYRRYLVATLFYYMCYAIFSVFLLLVCSRPWWQTLAGVIITLAVSAIFIRWYARRSSFAYKKLNLSPKIILYVVAVSVAQTAIQVVIYALELHIVNAHISLTQAITYTGAANLALFVALTPGAIGIREAFLLFSENLNHLNTANIVSASVIDRAVFLVFLAMLFLFALSLRAKGKMNSQTVRTVTE